MQISELPEVRVVKMPARVDANSAKTMETELAGLLQGGAKKLVCDFSENEYLSSAGLRVLLAALKQVSKVNGALVLCALTPFVREVLEMAGFLSLFRITGTVDEALKELA